jgi:hypothetical protein
MELATPRFKIPHMNFKKEILVPFRKILVPFRTTKDCHSCRSLFLVLQICYLNWDLDMDRFVGTFCISFDGPVATYLHVYNTCEFSLSKQSSISRALGLLWPSRLFLCICYSAVLIPVTFFARWAAPRAWGRQFWPCPPLCTCVQCFKCYCVRFHTL